MRSKLPDFRWTGAFAPSARASAAMLGGILLFGLVNFPASTQQRDSTCPDQATYESALVKFESADYAGALKILHHAADCGGFADADYWLGRSYLEIGEAKTAIAYFKEAVTIPELEVAASEWLATARFDRVDEVSIFSKSGFAKRARDLLIEVIATHPEATRARFMLASFYLNAPGFMGGGHEKAMAEAEELATRDPALYERFMAREAIDRKAFEEAAAHYAKSLDLNPDYRTYQEAIRYLLERERSDDALALATEAKLVHPDLPCIDLLLASTALAADEELKVGRNAVERFNAGGRKFCERASAAIEGYFLAASLHERLGDSVAAGAAYTSILGLDPENKQAKDAIQRLGR